MLSGQSIENKTKKFGSNPTVFLDSIETTMSELKDLNPMDISNITLVQPKNAKKLLGDKGIDGAMYVTTKKSARDIYWKFFSSKSVDYKNLLPNAQADTIVQYVLNGIALSDSTVSGDLFLIANDRFKSITVVDKDKMQWDKVYPKRYMVVVSAKRPKGLIKTKR
jgi:hypothetical protein